MSGIFGEHEIEATRTALRGVAEEYRDGLRAETRRRILASTLNALERRRAEPRRTLQLLPQLAAAAAVALLLVLPALYGDRIREAAPGAGEVAGLEVKHEDGRIVLTWDEGQGPRRVARATSREQLSDLSRLPSVEVTGDRWVDDRPDGAPVVYYVVQ